MSRAPQHDDGAGRAAGPTASITFPPARAGSARRTRPGPLVLAALVALVGLVGPPSAAGAAPPEPVDAAAAAASPLTGMEVRANQTGPDHQPVKDVHVSCPAGKVAVGGSATVQVAEDGGGPWPDDNQISLRASLPNLVPVTGRYEWIARASETRTGTPRPWALVVQVRCADRPAGYVFVNKSTPPSLTSPQVADPVCPAGLVALGGGATVRNAPDGRGVGLQVVRVDVLGGLLRTQARTHPGGNPDPWGLTAIALCAQRPQRFQVTDGPFGGPSSATIQKSSVFCQGGRSLVSHGAAIDSSAPGNATLQSIGSAGEIFGNVKGVEHVATSYPWGDVLARGVCADAAWASD